MSKQGKRPTSLPLFVDKFLWDENKGSAGHCAVTSLIVQDYFGGDIMFTHVKGNKKWTHFYNRINGKKVDLTHNQFAKNTKFVKPVVVSRKYPLNSKRTQRGYNILKRRVAKIQDKCR